MADLFHRVSIRKYKDEAVSNEDIGYILEAAMAAPSAKNQQPWEFYVVENREVLKQLGESSPFSAPAGKAPVAIVTAYREECDLPEFAQIDMSIMMENLWLAADEIGLGGVWLGVAPREDRMKDVEKIVGIPAGQRVFGIFALGYPDEERTQQDRFDQSRIHYVK